MSPSEATALLWPEEPAWHEGPKWAFGDLDVTDSTGYADVDGCIQAKDQSKLVVDRTQDAKR